MMSKAMLLGVVVTLGLAGCQHHARKPDFSASTLKCGGQQCDVKVTVDNCVVSVDPEVLDLRQGSGNQDITWKLATDGYTFSTVVTNAIVIKSDDPSGQFHSPSHQGRSITLKFKHKTPGQYYEYGVNVVRTADGQRCSTKDPWVVE